MSIFDDILDWEDMKDDPPRKPSEWCSEGAEKTCDSYPLCYGCNAWRNPMYKSRHNKENHMMNLGDAKVIVGGMAYPCSTVEFNQEMGKYPSVDVRATLNPFNAHQVMQLKSPEPVSIKNVIFNPPATIVFWSDNTKTVVKCDGDKEMYDPEKGIAMAISRKMMGDNKREYYNTFMHWLKKWNKQNKDAIESHTTVKVDTDYDCYEYDFED